MKKGLLVHPSELSRKWIDKLAQNNFTTLGIHPEGGLKAHESLGRLVDLLSDKRFTDLLDYAEEKGLNIEYEFHALSYLLPRSLFSKNPEFFRMNENGERTPDLNMCFSSEEALDIVAENARVLAKKLYKSSSNYFFWIDDASAGKCNCAKCAGLSMSDQQLIFSNRILRALREEKEDAKVAYLAYIDALSVPEKILPEEGIFVEYAPIFKWKKKILEPDFNSDLVEAEKNACIPFLNFFGRENSRILEYWVDNSLFSRWTKPPKKLDIDLEQLKSDLAFYKDAGYSDVSSFACYLGEDYEDIFGEADLAPFFEAFYEM